MYDLQKNLRDWLPDFREYIQTFDDSQKNDEVAAFKIIFEAAIEIYLSTIQPSTTITVRAILTRTLIECHADAYSIFRRGVANKKAKRYIKYAKKLDGIFRDQSTEYVQMRDSGVDGKIRPFQLLRQSEACWDGKNVIDRIEASDHGKHNIAYYEFFSLFTHMSPIRQTYLQRINDEPAINNYHNYIMLLIMQILVSQPVVKGKYFESLNIIAGEYAADYIEHDYSPPLKQKLTDK